MLNNQVLRLVVALMMGVGIGVWLFGSGGQEHVHEEQVANETIWTCSMHPQIRQKEPGQCPICGMDLIPLQSADSGQENKGPFVYTMSPSAKALANIQTSTVQAENLTSDVTLTGRIAVNEQQLGTITAHYAGRIEALFVDYTGQRVQKGQKLATIYSPELITAQKELLETAKNKASNPTLYNAAREKLRLWKITADQMNRIESTGEIVTQFDVYTDLSGVVLNRKVTRGDHVGRGSALFEIADLSTVWVLLDAYETDLAWIELGSDVNFTVSSLPRQTFSSKVTFIDPVIHPKTRTASVRAEATNPQMKLKPDMFVDAQVRSTGHSDEKVLVIPKSSVLWTGTRSVVYVDLSDAQNAAFEMREVVLGPRAGEKYVVLSGLEAGEDIVTNGVFAVDAAAQLSGNYSMMSRPENKLVAVPEPFRDLLGDVASDYFGLKNALVNGQPNLVADFASKLHTTLQSFDSVPLSETSSKALGGNLGALLKTAEHLSHSHDLAVQRKNFEPLSKSFLALVDAVRLKDQLVHVAFCPMASDNEGAVWASEFEEIANPYFGESMLQCGEVQRTIPKHADTGNVSHNQMTGHKH